MLLIGLFDFAGDLLAKFGFEPAPMLLGFVLGRSMEENFRRALLVSRGDMATFIESPISAGLLAIAAIMLVVVLLPSFRREREDIFAE